MFESIELLLRAHPVLAPIGFVLLRMLPIIIPPIPGIAFDLLGIALFGWKFGLVLALIAGHVASVIAFFIARYNRDFVARHVAPLRALHALEEHYSEKQKFWMLVAVRFVTSPMFDYVNYVAGLTRMSFGKYLLSTFIGIFPYAFCIYYFGEKLLETNWLYGSFAFIGIAMLLGIFQEKFVGLFMGRAQDREQPKM